MVSKEKFSQGMILLFTSKKQVIDNNLIKVWYEIAKNDFTDDQWEDSIMVYVKSDKDFPTLGKLYKVMNDKKPKQMTEAELAWKNVLYSAQRGGRISITEKSAQVLKNWGGMMYLRNLPEDKLNWARKEFIEIYNSYPGYVECRDCIGLEAPLVKCELTRQHLQKYIGGENELLKLN